MPRRRKPFFFKNLEGVEYEVLFMKPHAGHYGEDTHGICSSPEDENPKIYISPYLSKQSELNTSIHEFCHAFFWDKSEHDVYAFSGALSRFLYNYCKWRKLERRKYRKGKAHESELLEKEILKIGKPKKNKRKS